MLNEDLAIASEKVWTDQPIEPAQIWWINLKILWDRILDWR